ncbi:MOSC domain-containing protein [bacterium]|nr:MAG: MOSC domain-containing protein [bacterium]
MGEIAAICISREKGTVKQPVPAVELKTDFGIVGDAHAGPGHRQVSLLPGESIARVRALMPDLADGAFAENLITSGLDLGAVTVGDHVRIGADVDLQVTQIGKECHHGCAIRQITGDCIMPREGIFCRVVSGGRVEKGAPVVLAGASAQGA